MSDFQKVGVVGLGTMGAGIAVVFASAGLDVLAIEADEQRAAAGLADIEKFLDGSVSRDKLTVERKAEVLARITASTTVKDLADRDVVLESVTEDLSVKKRLFADLAAVVGPEVPLLTNTSALSVTDLAASVAGPERVAGLHFFNPAPVMRTVEVVHTLDTDPALIQRLVDLVADLSNKDAVVVKDRPGFLVNALLLPYLNDVIGELDDDLATAEDLDVALKLGLGYKMGPMEMLDMIGLDVHLHATTNAYLATGDARYAPPPLLQQMVATGRLGTKSGSGFRTAHDKEN